MRKITGIIAAPFAAYNETGKVNTEIIGNYAQFLKRNDIAGAFINGTAGEGFSLSLHERRLIAEAWVEKSPVELKTIIHVAHTSIVDSINLARHAEQIGADAIASMAPIFFKPGSLEQLVDSMAEIAAAAPSLPFYFYHMPAMSGVNFAMIDFLKAAEERIPNLAGIKFTYENLMDFQQCRIYKDGKYDMLHGRDEILLCSLAIGTRGAVGATYNYIAPVYTRMIEAYVKGDIEEARRLQLVSIKVIDALLKTGNFLSASKALMKKIGLDFGAARSPLNNLPSDKIETLFRDIEDVDPESFCSVNAL